MGVLASHGLLVTVTEAVALFPAIVAVMVTGPPAATPVTKAPCDPWTMGETVAIAALLVVHVTTCFVKFTLFWSRTSAARNVVPPMETEVAAGDTETDVTIGSTTDTVTVPL